MFGLHGLGDFAHLDEAAEPRGLKKVNAPPPLPTRPGADGDLVAAPQQAETQCVDYEDAVGDGGLGDREDHSDRAIQWRICICGV